MKLSVLGLCAVGAAAILFQTGTTAKFSTAVAADSCIVTNVTLHVKRCPPGLKYAAGGGSDGGGMTEPTVTPTAGPPESCIKTNVALHVKRCPA